MSTIVTRFSKCLTAIEYPKEKTSWNISGIIKGQNAFYRFDVRNMFNLSDERLAQTGHLNSQAQKMVLEGEKDWLILDLEELKFEILIFYHYYKLRNLKDFLNHN